MTASGLLLSLVQLVVVFGAIAAAQTALSWWAGRRGGRRGLVLAWVGSALVLAVVFAARVHQRQTQLGFRTEQRHDTFMFFGAVTVALLSFGASTLVVRRRLRRAPERLGVAGVVRGAAAAIGGLLAVFLVVFLTDVAALIQRLSRS